LGFLHEEAVEVVRSLRKVGLKTRMFACLQRPSGRCITTPVQRMCDRS
jgi:hypothetical protein